MSVYKKPNSPFYHFDFRLGGRRFHGSTCRTAKREAEQVETQERANARELVKATRLAAGSLQIDAVADRYWANVGKHHAGADNTDRDLKRLVKYFGEAKPLTEITDADVMKLVAWRRAQKVPVQGKRTAAKEKAAPLIAPATVNRSTTEVLKKLFTFAKSEGVRFDHEPAWKKHWLSEPVERVRELHDDEAEKIDATMRDDFAPFFAFVRETGLRQKECVTLRWSEINFGTKQIVRLGKGGKRLTFPITDSLRELLWPLQGHHAEFVFTYVAVRTRKKQGLIRGQRRPLTLSGVKTRWRRMRKAAGVSGFRFHDFRHDFGTKLLRETGNLKLVSKAMNHGSIKTTMKYAHVLDDEIAAALEQRDESRTKPRTTIREVS